MATKNESNMASVSSLLLINNMELLREGIVEILIVYQMGDTNSRHSGG